MSKEWKRLFDFLESQGLPSELLCRGCITATDAKQITDLINKKSPQKILEVGTFVGLSTGIITLAMDMSTQLLSIDPNFPIDLQGQQFGFHTNRPVLEYAKALLSYIQRLENTRFLEGFFSQRPQKEYRKQVLELGINEDLIPIVGDRIAEYGLFYFAFIDGDHHANNVFQDLMLINHYITPGGTIVLHDLEGNWANEVMEGVRQFLEASPNFSFSVDGNLGLLNQQ